MRYCPLFSGSRGNCTYISDNAGAILVDLGVSARRAEQALRTRDIDPQNISAIVITHEHSDHIAGVRLFARKFGCTVIASPGTLNALRRHTDWDGISMTSVLPGSAPQEIAGLELSLFHTPHDSAESAGVCVQTSDGRRMAVATDMGTITPEIHAALLGCDLVHLESNHDVDMLAHGPYAAHLKRRILGDHGHLSNVACAEELIQLIQGGTSRVVLAHLSQENNTPTLAYETVRGILNRAGLRDGQAYMLTVAMQEDNHPVLML